MIPNDLSVINKKWQSLIEGIVDAKSTDGYLLRIFVIAFTSSPASSPKRTCYAQKAQVRKIRAKMHEFIIKEVTNCDLSHFVNKLALNIIENDIQKICQRIYPLHDVYIRKVKVLKKPRFDLSKLLELHGDGGGTEAIVSAEGAVIETPEGYEPPVQA